LPIDLTLVATTTLASSIVDRDPRIWKKPTRDFMMKSQKNNSKRKHRGIIMIMKNLDSKTITMRREKE